MQKKKAVKEKQWKKSNTRPIETKGERASLTNNNNPTLSIINNQSIMLNVNGLNDQIKSRDR